MRPQLLHFSEYLTVHIKSRSENAEGRPFVSSILASNFFTTRLYCESIWPRHSDCKRNIFVWIHLCAAMRWHKLSLVQSSFLSLHGNWLTRFRGWVHTLWLNAQHPVEHCPSPGLVEFTGPRSWNPGAFDPDYTLDVSKYDIDRWIHQSLYFSSFGSGKFLLSFRGFFQQRKVQLECVSCWKMKVIPCS